MPQRPLPDDALKMVARGADKDKNGFFSGCGRSNPNRKMAEKLWGHSPAGLFGYSHILRGYAGRQAEYMRVPYADVGPIKVPEGLSDEQVLFLSDIFPTGIFATLREVRQ